MELILLKKLKIYFENKIMPRIWKYIYIYILAESSCFYDYLSEVTKKEKRKIDLV